MNQFPYCDFPVSLMIQTTSRCNAACIFCPYPSVSKELRHGEMSFSLYAKIIKECQNHPHLKSINLFLMNEPLMDPFLIERIRFARKLNPNVSLNIWTNGCDLEKTVSRELIHSGLDAVGISIHAMWPSTYQLLTGRQDFDRVLRRVTRFVTMRNNERPSLRVDIRLVGIEQLLSQQEVQEALAHWHALGVNSAQNLLGHVNRAGNLPGTYQVLHPEINGCSDRMPYHMAAILFSGEVVLCCMDWRREAILGNVATDSLAAIWRSPQRKALLEAIAGSNSAPDFICKRCEESIEARPK